MTLVLDPRPHCSFNGTKRLAGMLLVIFALVILIMLAGCGTRNTDIPRAQAAYQRNNLDQATQTIREEHLEWTHNLGPGGKREALPKLSAEQVARREAAHKSYEAYVASLRATDVAVGVVPSSQPASPSETIGGSRSFGALRDILGIP